AALLARSGDTCRLIHLDEVVPAQDLRNGNELVDRLVETIARFVSDSSAPLRGLINLWALDLASAASVDAVEAAQNLIFSSTAAQFRSVAESSFASRIWLVTRNAVAALPDDAATEVAAATLWGLGRSAALEHPQMWGGLLDLDADGAPPTDAEAIVQEILRGDGEDQIAIRSGRRLAPRFVRAEVPAAAPAGFDSEASYLITGGLGALGAELGQWLVTRRGVRRLGLTSRRREGGT